MADKKQDRIEYMVQKFQEIVGKYDAISASLQKFALENDKHLEFVQNLSKDLDSAKKSQESLFAMISQHKQEQAGLWTIAGDISDKLGKRIDAIKLDVKNEAVKHDQHAKAFQDVKEELSKKASLNNHVEAFSKLKSEMDKLSDKVFGVDQKQGALVAKIASYDDALKIMNSERSNLRNEIQAHKEFAQSIKDECKADLLEHKKTVEQALLNVATVLNIKIDSLPKPEKPDLSDIKKDVSKQIEPAFLDAKNANLRSQNNEVKLSILEKKLEQLQLLLNKLQLQG